jgi:hypothetical protein
MSIVVVTKMILKNYWHVSRLDEADHGNSIITTVNCRQKIEEKTHFEATNVYLYRYVHISLF